MYPILQLGPLAIQVPGLLLLAGLWLGLTLSEKHAQRFGIHPEKLYNLVFAALVAGVLGARLAYAGRFPQAFLDSPGSLLSLNPGLLDAAGGLAIALIAAALYGQKQKMPLWPTLDALTPMLAALAIAAALANLASGSGFGLSADLPWSIEIWGARRHPSQVYELLTAGAILALLWPSRLQAVKTSPGSYFLHFLALSAGARLFLEGFRGDSSLLFAGLRTAQVASWLLLAVGLWVLKLRSTAAPYPGRPARKKR